MIGRVRIGNRQKQGANQETPYLSLNAGADLCGVTFKDRRLDQAILSNALEFQVYGYFISKLSFASKPIGHKRPPGNNYVGLEASSCFGTDQAFDWW